ncbi:hypothetical protein Ctob_013894, partial [Chrysochromulina tobinii]
MSMERETQALLFDVVSSKLVGALPDGRASRRAKATAAAAAERASLFPTVSLTDLFCYDTLPLQLPQPQEQLRGGTSEPAAVLEKKAARKVIKTSPADVVDKEAAKEAKATGKAAKRNLEVELHGLLPSAEDVEALALEAERPEDGDEDRDEDDEEMDRSGDARAREAASCELKGHPLPKHNQAEKKRERREKSRTSTKAQRSLENAALPLPAVPLGEPLTGSLEAAAVAKPPELPPLLKSARKSLSKSRSTLLAPQLPCPKCAKPFDHHKNVAARNSHIKSCLLSEQPPKRHKKGTELVTALEAVLTTALEEVKEEATTASLRAHVTTEASMDGQAKQET